MNGQEGGGGYILFGHVHVPLPMVLAGGFQFHRADDADPDQWLKLKEDPTLGVRLEDPFYEGVESVTLFMLGGGPIELFGLELERFIKWHKEVFGPAPIIAPAPASSGRRIAGIRLPGT